MADKTELTPEQQEIAALRKQLAESDAEKKKQAEQLKKQEDELAASNAEKEEQAKLLEEQEERLSLAEAQKGKPLPVVLHNKKKYQVLAAKIQHPTNPEVTVSAAQLAEDKDLIALLVKIRSGVLVEVEPSK
jgi:septal ring factor EnvC (AmiA/AmiB activator)